MRRSREPIGNTCPTINNAISYADQIKSLTKDMYYYSEQIENDLEELRRANDSLRNWGNEEAERVDELEAEVDELKSIIENLKEQIKLES